MNSIFHPKCRILVFYLFLFLFQSNRLEAQVPEPLPPCCSDSLCKNQALGYVNRFVSITSSPLFDDPPLIKKELQGQLRGIRKQDSKIHKQFTSEIQSFTRWLDRDEGERGFCFYGSLDAAHDNTKNWVRETTSLLREIKPYSPEFCKGFRFHVEAGTGVKDLTASSESFIGSLTALVSYTFAPRDKNLDVDTLYHPQQCNGRFRVLAGLSESYTDHIGLTQGVLRSEIKLFDIKTEFFSVGNVKGIVQANVGLNRSYHSIGLGIGADSDIVGFNFIYGFGFSNIHSVLQTSLVYHFIKRK